MQICKATKYDPFSVWVLTKYNRNRVTSEAYDCSLQVTISKTNYRRIYFRSLLCKIIFVPILERGFMRKNRVYKI